MVFNDEFGTYVCPDTSHFDVFNKDIKLDAVIYSCSFAETIGYSEAYGNQTCQSYEELKKSFNETAF